MENDYTVKVMKPVATFEIVAADSIEDALAEVKSYAGYGKFYQVGDLEFEVIHEEIDLDALIKWGDE